MEQIKSPGLLRHIPGERSSKAAPFLHERQYHQGRDPGIYITQRRIEHLVFRIGLSPNKSVNASPRRSAAIESGSHPFSSLSITPSWENTRYPSRYPAPYIPKRYTLTTGVLRISDAPPNDRRQQNRCRQICPAAKTVQPVFFRFSENNQQHGKQPQHLDKPQRSDTGY